MSFQLREIDRSKLYTSIVDQILEGVRSSAFPPGEALPSERVLADQLGVSRSSVREAIRVLEHAGVLDVRTGSGTYVTHEALSQAAALRARAAVVGEQSPLDVMVARRALEPLCASLAAEHRNRQDLRTLRTMIEEQAVQVAEGQDPSSADLRFHLAIGAATHNPVLELLLDRVVDVMRQDTWRQLKHNTLEHPGKPREYLAHHEQMFACIEAQEPERAQAAMSMHLDSVEAGLLANVDDGGRRSVAP